MSDSIEVRQKGTEKLKGEKRWSVFYIGVCFSLLHGNKVTIITLTIFKYKYSDIAALNSPICYNRRIRTKDVSKFHIQLCLSLSFLLIVFFAGNDRVSVRAGCNSRCCHAFFCTCFVDVDGHTDVSKNNHNCLYHNMDIAYPSYLLIPASMPLCALHNLGIFLSDAIMLR